MVEFTSKMDERDYRSLVYFTSYSKHTWVVGMMVLGMALSLTVLITKLLGVFSPSPLLFWLAVIYIAVTLLPLYLTEKNIKNTVAAKGGGINRRLNFKADAKGFKVSDPENGKSHTYEWNSVDQIYETPEYFIVYTSGRNAFIWNKAKIGAKADALHGILKALKSLKYNDRSKKRRLNLF